jgi:hypothetical protein
MDIRDRRSDLAGHALTDAQPQFNGASGYFTAPSDHLDPHLFHGTAMRPEVRRWVLEKLYRFWDRKYRNAHAWSRVWIAGSGVTYQWAAGRESGGAPGDLDTLIGVDFPTFFRDNRDYAALDANAMAAYFNDQFRAELDLDTNNATLPTGGTYEVTFYVNPGAADIRAIHPYAAYDLTDNTWTVTPPRLPQDWGIGAFDKTWWDAVGAEHSQAQDMVNNYYGLRGSLMNQAEGSPEWVNTTTQLHSLVGSGKMLFDSIHNDRHMAFGPGGNGYADYYNFRWQAHKRDGVVPALHALANIYNDAHKDTNARCYNGNSLDAGHALTMASLIASRGI